MYRGVLVMKKLITSAVLVTAIILLAGCPAVEDHPCDGDWEFNVEDAYGKRGSVRIYVFESEIYSFRGTYYDPEEEEEVIFTVGIYGNGIPLTPLYYDDDSGGGYYFEYPEDVLPAGYDHFSGMLWPETGKAYCNFGPATSSSHCHIEVDSGAFTPSE